MSKALNQRQLRAVELMVYQQMRKQDIAAELGVTPSTISQWVKKPEFDEALKNEMYRAFQPLAYKARQKIGELIDSGNDQVALAASKDILDRAGFGATQKVDQTVTNKDIVIEIRE